MVIMSDGSDIIYTHNSFLKKCEYNPIDPVFNTSMINQSKLNNYCDCIGIRIVAPMSQKSVLTLGKQYSASCQKEAKTTEIGF